VRKIRGQKPDRRRVRIGAPDPSVTGNAGVAVLGELIERLGVVAALDTAIGPIKSRDRGATAGQFLMALAQTQLCGHDYLVGMDRVRADTVATELSAVPIPAATTAATLARRFTGEQWLSIEDGLAAVARRVLMLLPAPRRAVLAHTAPTVDLDTTDTETYGQAKQGVTFNHMGKRVGRTHLASWAQAGIPLAADLRHGTSDPRTYSVELMDRALASLARIGVYRPDDPTAPRPVFRMDTGYMSGALAVAAVEAESDFAIGVRRGKPVWAAVARVPAHAWAPAAGMRSAQVAVADYVPTGGPPAPGAWCAGSASTPPPSPPTPAPDAGAPSIPTNSPSPSTVNSTPSTPTPSSPPTCPSTPAPTPCTWRPGTGNAPTSRTASATPNTVRRCGTCPPATPP
jgi:hypothetical protein